MEKTGPAGTLSLSHDLSWRLITDPSDPASLRLEQYRSNASAPEGSIELTAEDLPHIRSWMRKVLFAAEWPSEFEFAGAGILQMIPQPRPELYLERLAPGRGHLGYVIGMSSDMRKHPDVSQRLRLYEADISLVVDWFSAWAERLHGEDRQNWRVADGLRSRTPEEKAAEEAIWDGIDYSTDATYPVVSDLLPTGLGSSGESGDAPGSIQETSDEDDEEGVATEIGGGAHALPEVAAEPDSPGDVSTRRHAPDADTSVFQLMLSRRIDPGRTFSLKEVREIAEWARQEGEDRLKNPILIVLYIFGLPLLAFWLWGVAKQVLRRLF